MNNQIFPDTEGLAADFAHVRFLTRMYTHMNLKISLARHGLSAHFAGDLILSRMNLEVDLKGGFPIALKVAYATLVLLSLTVGLHMHSKIGGAGIGSAADLADKRLLSRMSEHVTFEGLIGVKALVANLAVRNVLLIVLLLVQPQIIARHLGYAANVAGKSLVVLLQMGLQELFGFEAFSAQNALKWLLLLMHFNSVLL